MTTTKLPSEPRPIRMDPELAEAVDEIIKPLKGKDLEAAQAAVMDVYRSNASGKFAELLENYREAIEEAVTAP